MLGGHYAVGYWAKRVDPTLKLWHLFLAVQWLDIVWSPLVLLGIEKADTRQPLPASPIHLTYMPYSHGLLAAMLWSVAAYCVYRFAAGPRRGVKSSLILASAVLSHWVLDVIVHDRDLPLLGNRFKVGFGVYRSIPWSFGIESALLLLGLLLYMASTRPVGSGFNGRYGMLLVFLALLLFNANSIWGPFPPNENVVAVFNLVYYIGFAAVIAKVERTRVPKAPSTVPS